MARATMADLIARVRERTGATSTSLTMGATQLFSDDHVQSALDRYRTDLWGAPLTPEPHRASSGDLTWTDYYCYHGDLETTDGGTAVFVVRTSTGEVRASAGWSMDYQRGHLVMAADQRGTALMVDARAYCVHSAAAWILDEWATHLARAYDYKIGDQSFDRSQMVKNLREQARAERRHARAGSGKLIRTDEQAGEPVVGRYRGAGR